MINSNKSSVSSGLCLSCGEPHYLAQGKAGEHCLELMKTLENFGRIDIHVPEQEADPRLSLNYIKGDAGGQMFGVLECLDRDGHNVILKAFSGQYNGVWKVEGWAPPLLDVIKFDQLVNNTDKKIKDLGKRIDGLPEGPERLKLTQDRKKLSRDLMKKIHTLYRVHNFRSQERPLSAFFKNGIPTGTGDCCAPKLLNTAARQNLKPIGLAEIYWGRTNRSGTRRQGNFYPPCRKKCHPLLGFMLCGI